jgi:hypothetical protein
MNTSCLAVLGGLVAALSGAAGAVCPLSALAGAPVWAGPMADWSRTELGAQINFGAANLERDAQGLRARYPRGSYDPAAVRSAGAPLGGAQFQMPFARMKVAVADQVGVRFRVQFQENFQFVKGGKLPGLYAGTANSGGHVPNGKDGWSMRFVWQAQGEGAISAYLPTSGHWGSVFGLGQWRFVPGRSHELALYIKMNTPGQANGVIAAWADDALVAYAADVVFRSVEELGIDGLYFSTFFGGSTPDWATPVDTSTRFGAMAVFGLDARALADCADPYAELRKRREIN